MVWIHSPWNFRAQGPQFGRGLGVIWFEPQGFLITLHRVENLSQPDEGIAQINVNPRIIGRKPQRLAIMPRRFVKTVFNEQNGGEIVVGVGKIGVQFQRRLKIRDRLGVLFLRRQRNPQIIKDVCLGQAPFAARFDNL